MEERKKYNIYCYSFGTCIQRMDVFNSYYLWQDGKEHEGHWFDTCMVGECGCFGSYEEAELFLEKYLMNQKVEQCKADIAALQEQLKKLEDEASRTVRDGDVWEISGWPYLLLVRDDKIFVTWDFKGSVNYPKARDNNWVYDTLLKEGTFKYNVFGD